MGKALHLYVRYVLVSMRSQMQYRGSFLLQTFAQFVVTGSEFLGLVVLFGRFGHIRGWTLPEIGLFYGMVSVAFALSEMVARSFDSFDRMVRSGEFDRLLLRPRSSILQMMGQDFGCRAAVGSAKGWWCWSGRRPRCTCNGRRHRLDCCWPPSPAACAFSRACS
jgi:ABC-type uncharacterized transport system permease subunit